MDLINPWHFGRKKPGTIFWKLKEPGQYFLFGSSNKEHKVNITSTCIGWIFFLNFSDLRANDGPNPIHNLEKNIEVDFRFQLMYFSQTDRQFYKWNFSSTCYKILGRPVKSENQLMRQLLSLPPHTYGSIVVAWLVNMLVLPPPQQMVYGRLSSNFPTKYIITF